VSKMAGTMLTLNRHSVRTGPAAWFLRYSGWCFLPVLLISASCDKPREGPNRSASEEPAAEVWEPDDGKDEPLVDLRDALREAAAIENAGSRHAAIAGIAWRAVSGDPELAREALGMLPAQAVEQRVPLIRHLAMQMAHEDTMAALKWADGLGSELETAVAKSRIALVVAENDPRQAATMLAEAGEAGRELDVAIVQVLQQWAAKEPVEAADWLAMFPAGNFRKAGVQAVISRWLVADPPAAMGWLGSLENTDLRSEAIATAAGFMAGQPQKTREAWLQAADEATRAAILQQPVEKR